MKKIVEEIKNYWNSSPFWGKVVWVTSIFLSTSSIASLSDTVFAWKGFILHAIQFYRYIATPLYQLFYFIYGIRPTTLDIDLIVIFALFHAAYLKFQMQLVLNSRPEVKRTLWIYLRGAVGFILFLSIAVLIASYAIITDASYLFLAFVLWSFLHSALWPIKFLYMGKNLLPEIEQYNPRSKDKMLRIITNKYSILYIPYYGPVVIAIVVIAILAAINTGLSKPL